MSEVSYTDEDSEYQYRFCRMSDVLPDEMWQARDDSGWYGGRVRTGIRDSQWVRARWRKQWRVESSPVEFANLIDPGGFRVATALSQRDGQGAPITRLFETIASLLNEKGA